MKPSQAARAIAAAQQALPEPGHAGKHAKVKAVLDRDRMRPGDEATLGVVVDVDAGHKLQMHRPPVKGLISTDLILNSVLGIKSFRYPNYPAPKAPKTQTSGVPANPEYRDQFVITVPVVATDSLSGPVVKFTGLLRYQACTLSGACYAPQYASFELEVPVAAKGALVSPANQDVFAPK
jgi:thiol:disulfide interchange protein